jgi:hypothetical protein
MAQRDFEYAAVNALERLRLVGLASLGCDGQGAANLKLHLDGERLQIPQGGLQALALKSSAMLLYNSFAASSISLRSVMCLSFCEARDFVAQ